MWVIKGYTTYNLNNHLYLQCDVTTKSVYSFYEGIGDMLGYETIYKGNKFREVYGYLLDALEKGERVVDIRGFYGG